MGCRAAPPSALLFIPVYNMAEGHNISSTSLNENFQNSASSISNSVRLQPIFINDAKYCNINDNLKFSWTRNLESLKYFIEKDIKFKGIWTSPGGERKSCSDGKTTITWGRNKKSIQIRGAEAENIKRSFCHILTGSHYNMNIKEPMVNNCSCNCIDIATDIEGVKLDAVIAEREMKSTIAQNSLPIENLQTQLNSFADLVVVLKGSEPILKAEKVLSDEFKLTPRISNVNKNEGEISNELEFYKTKAEVFEQKYCKLNTTLDLKQNTKTNTNELTDQALVDSNLNQDKQHMHNTHCLDAAAQTIEDHNFNNSVIISSDITSFESNDSNIMVI